MSDNPDGTAAEQHFDPRSVHPKVFAVDLPEKDFGRIRAGRFNVTAGSFGTPVEVKRSENYAPININGRLPGITEQEIVVVDLSAPAPDPELGVGEKPIGEGVWQQKDRGLVDPRPYLMSISRSHFERIYEHGGIFIVFAAARSSPNYVWASERRISFGREMRLDNWCFLDVLSKIETSYDVGAEITPARSTSPLFAPIAAALGDARFECLVEAGASLAGRWVTLAHSKYGEPVAGMLGPEPDSTQGFVIVLPQIERKGELVLELLEGLLPEIAPKLFPEDERQAWVDDQAFEPPSVAGLRAEIERVEADTSARVASLRKQIGALLESEDHLRGLLTATGDELVTAVKETLEALGFEDVRDVDVEEGIKEGRRREDLQIRADSPVVLCEVKGINNLPSDEDALQVARYVLPRIKEWDRTDVRGLTVVNHQRGLPPVDRDPQVFQGDQVGNAEGQDVGLLTTLDLYRLARGYARNGWRHEDVVPLFTAVAGLVEPLPAHYKPIGQVVNFYEKAGALTVLLDDGVGLAVGDRVAFALPLDFVEEEVEGIQIDGEGVDPAPAAAHVGLITRLSKSEARKGTRVYRVGVQK